MSSDDEIRAIPPRMNRSVWSALLDHGLEKSADYVVRMQNSIVQAINGHSGIIDYHDPDPAVVMQATHDALPEGGLIFVKRAWYIPNKKITLSNPVSVIGQRYDGSVPGAHGTYFQLANNVNDDAFRITGNYVTLANLTIHGNGNNQTTGNCLYMAGCYDVDVENVSLFYGKTHCLYMGSAFGCHFKQLYAELSVSGYGIRLVTGANENLFEMFDVFGNFLGGVSIYGAALTNTFFHGRYERCTATNAVGLRLRNNGAYIPMDNQFIGGFYYENYLHGISIEGAQDNTFIGPTIRDNSQGTTNTGDAIILQDGEASAHSLGNIIIAPRIKNSLTKKQRYGVNEADANQDYNQLLGGYITNCVTAAVRMQGPHSTHNHEIVV